MPCEFCSEATNVEKYRLALDPTIPLHYCPACGENLNLVNVLFCMEKAVREAWAEENNTVEIDGEILKFERLPSPEKRPPVKPRDMTVDLDKIDISKEMAMLREHDLKTRRDYFAERVKHFMEEKMKDDT